MIDAACTTTLLQGDKSTYIGQPADQYRLTPPPSARRILPSQSSPAALPAERANFDSELPIIPPKEIAYSDDNDSLQNR